MELVFNLPPVVAGLLTEPQAVDRRFPNRGFANVRNHFTYEIIKASQKPGKTSVTRADVEPGRQDGGGDGRVNALRRPGLAV